MKKLLTILSLFISNYLIAQPVISANPSSTIVVSAGGSGTVTLSATGTGVCTWTKYYDYNLPNYVGSPRTYPQEPTDNATLQPYGTNYDYCTVSGMAIGTWYYQVTNSSGTSRIVINVDAYAAPSNSSLFSLTNFSNMAAKVNDRSMDTTVRYNDGSSYNQGQIGGVNSYYERNLQTLEWIDNMRGKLYTGIRDGNNRGDGLPYVTITYATGAFPGGGGELTGTTYIYDWKGYLDWQPSALSLPNNGNDITFLFENHPLNNSTYDPNGNIQGAQFYIAWRNGAIVPYEGGFGAGGSSDLTNHNGYLSGTTYVTTAPGATDFNPFYWQGSGHDWWPPVTIMSNADNFYNQAHNVRITVHEGDPGTNAFIKCEMDGKQVYLRNTGRVGQTFGHDYPLFEGMYDHSQLLVSGSNPANNRQRNVILEKVATYIMTGNNAPIVNAGADQTLSSGTTSTTLNGSYTRDDGGYIASLSWTQLSGPSATFPNGNNQYIESVNLGGGDGTYVFRLAATDNSGTTAYDTINVYVNAIANPPVANAGADQNLSFGVSSTTLSGTGTPYAGRSIVSYLWQLTSGSGAVISAPSSATTNITNLASGQSYTFTLTVTDDAGATGQDQVNVTVNSSGGYASLLTGIISYWKLDETSGVAVDATGVGGGNNNGSVNNATQGIAGKLNTAYSFNGTSSYVSMGNPSNLSLSSSGSISAWVNLATLSPSIDGLIVGKGNWSTDRNGYLIVYEHTNQRFTFELANSSAAQTLGFNGVTLSPNTWINLIVTWNSNTITTYMNGANPTTVAQTLNAVSTLYNFALGYSQAVSAHYFNGTIDEVGVWNRALTAQEVGYLYNSGSALAYPYASQLTPSIIWPNPASITYPTALSSTQLNASASYNSNLVAGTHTYTVNGQTAGGVIFNAGGNNYILDNFVPNDNVTYTTASKQDTIIVNKGTATLSYQSLSSAYTGSANPVVVNTSPSNLTVISTTYNGTGNVPSVVGSYAVASGLQNSNYTATPISGTYTITAAPVTFTVGNNAQVYDSSQKSVSVSTSPANIPYTAYYNGSTTSPRYSGTYVVHIKPTDSTDYSGSYDGTMTISKGMVSYTWNMVTSTITYGTALGVNQLNASFSKAGVVTYSPVSGTVLNAGPSVPITANYVPNDTNLLPITSIVRNVTVNQAQAFLTVSDTIQSYDGTPKPCHVTCNQTGTITILYNGSSTVPTIVGNYPISVTFSSANYYANPYNGTLQITNNAATIYITNYQNRIYTGSQIPVTVTCSYPYSVTYNGSGTPPHLTGSYTVIATITSGATGADTVTMTIVKAPSTISYATTKTGTYPYKIGFGNLLTATSPFAGTITYNVNLGDTLAGGSYNITATIHPSDTNYLPSVATCVLYIGKGTATFTSVGWNSVYDNNLHYIVVTTNPPNLDSVVISYGGSGTPPINAGTYMDTIYIVNSNYTATPLIQTQTISRAPVTLSWITSVTLSSGQALTFPLPIANVAGTWVYNYPIGTVLPPGVYQLVATFIPSNSNYNGGSISSIVNISGAGVSPLILNAVFYSIPNTN